jgi:hypothetical protein
MCNNIIILCVRILLEEQLLLNQFQDIISLQAISPLTASLRVKLQLIDLEMLGKG